VPFSDGLDTRRYKIPDPPLKMCLMEERTNKLTRRLKSYWYLVVVVDMQVMVNLYSAHMDPDDWQQPQQFRPKRFLDQSGNVIDRDKVISFSLGRYMSTTWLGGVTVKDVGLTIKSSWVRLPVGLLSSGCYLDR